MGSEHAAWLSMPHFLPGKSERKSTKGRKDRLAEAEQVSNI